MSPTRLIRPSAWIARQLERPALGRLVWIASSLGVLAVVLVNAWVTEDAYITFRVVDNAVHGFGLRWNVDERVQVYTHPLWLLLQLPIYALTHEEFYTVIGLSALLTVTAWGVLAWPYRRVAPIVLCVLLIPLLSSHAFLEFSTSGLENPLSHLLALVFAAIFVGFRTGPPWGWLTLSAALLVMTRFDLVWIVVPAGLYLLWRHWQRIRWGRVVWGALPLIAWCVFSFLYYGSVMPNTKFAKLNTGVAVHDLVMQGVRYVGDLVRHDMPSALLIGLVLAGTIGCLWNGLRRGDDRLLRLAAVGVGVWLYVFYIVSVGGDFMSGRFFSVLVVLAVWWLAELIANHVPLTRQRLACVLLPSLVLIASVVQSSHYVRYFGAASSDDLDVIRNSGYVIDERDFYKSTNMLRRNLRGTATLRSHDWVREGLMLRANDKERVIVRGNAGMAVYYAGPKLRVIDTFALTDPLLARLPLHDPKIWRIGHFFRSLPEGLRRARETGDVSGMDPNLGQYYRALRTIARDPLFSPKRLRTLARFHLGSYDGYLERYVNGPMKQTVFPLSRLAQVGASKPNEWPTHEQMADPSVLIVADGHAYTFTAPGVIYAKAVDFETYGDCALDVRFYRGERLLGSLEAKPWLRGAKMPPLRRRVLPLPDTVSEQGFDRVTVQKPGRCFIEAMPAMLQHLLFL